MDPKYFILIFFCGYLNDTVFSEVEASTTEMQPPSTLFNKSLVSSVSANSQNSKKNSLDQPTQSNNVSSGQKVSPTKATAGQTLVNNTTKQPKTTANTSSQQTALSVFTSARLLPSSGHTSTKELPQPVYTSPQQQRSVHTSVRKPTTNKNLSTQATPTTNISARRIPEFFLETPSNKKNTHSTKSNSVAAVLIGIILTSMLIAIMMIVLWKYFKRPVLNDQNWAGRSPFADGETPDLCLDNIRENEVSTKRTSVISLKALKPSKSTLLADDLEIKLFESSENIEDSNPKAEKIKDQVNDTSEDSADRSTVGTAVSSSDDTDLPAPPPPLLDLEGQESNQSDTPATTATAPLPNDCTSLPPPLNCLTQVCEDPNSEFEQSLPLPPDSLNLPLPPMDFMKNHEDSNSETQCQEFSIVPDLDQDLNESLPLPPEELL
ncbi:PREDICTED: protein EVI2B [Condylura cristata]|uniref:protein EVI2B n=1 Tax=Condylura cristata TaxID=143302 RepID=UPI0006437A2B|nr:PREDICTED: protein EVI2B [Condylura cristata]